MQLIGGWCQVSHSCAPGQFDSSSWGLRGVNSPGVPIVWDTTSGLSILEQLTGALLLAAALVTELCLLGTMGGWRIPVPWTNLGGRHPSPKPMGLDGGCKTQGVGPSGERQRDPPAVGPSCSASRKSLDSTSNWSDRIGLEIPHPPSRSDGPGSAE